MEKVLEMLQAMQEEQKEQRAFWKEMRESRKDIQDDMQVFRKEVSKRLETLEKLIIQNGEKLDNNRDHVSKKMNFIEHKSLELEQRIFELESHYERQ